MQERLGCLPRTSKSRKIISTCLVALGILWGFLVLWGDREFFASHPLSLSLLTLKYEMLSGKELNWKKDFIPKKKSKVLKIGSKAAYCF